MRLLSLRFSNIHSLRGEQIIDFVQPPLSDTGIFAITGPTGSGKSTILDAITLALFGRISRLKEKALSNVIINDFGGVVTRGQTEAFSELTYQIGEDIYQSTWIFRKGKKNMILLKNGEAIQEKEKDVISRNEQIIGLSYGQFIRAVILPQGEFANFLKADSDERIRILEKITGGEIFRTLGAMASSITRDKKILLDQKKTEIDSIELLTQEQETEIRREIVQNQNRAEELKKSLNNLREKQALKQQIADLEREIRKQQAQIKEVIEQKQAMESDFHRLEMHERLIRYKAEIKQYLNSKLEREQVDQEIKELETNITSLGRELDRLSNTENDYNQKLKKLADELALLKPKIAKVRELDTQLAQLKTKIDTLDKQLGHLRQDEKKSQNQIQENQTNLQIYRQKYEQVCKWLEDNIALEDLTLEFGLIEKYIDEYNLRGGELMKKAKQNGYQVKDWQQLKRNLESDFTAEKQFIAQAQLQLGQHRDIEEISTEIEGLRSRLDVINSLKAKLMRSKEMQEKLQFLERERQEITVSLEQLTQEKGIAEQELSKLQRDRDELQKKMQQEQEVIVFRKARELLKEGEPCPVCGSIHHPYKEHHLDIEESDLEKKMADLEQQIQQLQQKFSKLQADISTKQALDREKQKQIREITQEKQNIDKQITEQASKSELETLEIERIMSQVQQIQQQIKKLASEQIIAQKLLKRQQKKQILEHLLSELDGVEQIHGQLKVKLESYQQYFPQGAKIKDIKETLRTLAKQYKDNIQSKTNLKAQIEKIESNLELQNQNITKISEEASVFEDELYALREQTEELVQRRRLLLGEQDPDRVLDLHENKRREIDESLKNLLQTKQRVSTQIEEQLKLVGQKRQHLDDVNARIENLVKQIMPKITALGIESPEQANDFFLSDEQYEKLTQIKQNLEKRLMELEQAIAEKQQRKAELSHRDDPNITIGELQKQISELTKQRDEINQTIGSKQKVIEQNEQNKAKQEHLLEQQKQLEADYMRWKALDDVIGNAEGTKFQRIAQEFNLIALLNAANMYLAKFNDRYQLSYQKQERSGRIQYSLFVVDNYLGGQQRSVNTLSGGESFLVSLSLAIGLSALASQKIRIENIFIDEGFGSLDNETLDQALAVLEHFHSDSNRKIGIISHVEVLKERIPVKIEVSRVEQGFSKINVVVR